ncbi:MAG: IPT/TIG domain-containing protein, partial [Blastocatellales bacterium]
MTKSRFLTHTIFALLALGMIGFGLFSSKPASAQTRTVRVVSANATSGTTANVVIEFVGLGNENGIGFSLTFDQTKLSNPQVVPGNLPSGANLNPNANQSAQGRLGILLALSPGTVFPTGTRQLLTVTFNVAAGAAAGASPIGFGDLPIGREIADASANVLPATFTPGTLTISDPNNPIPTLTAISPNLAPAGTSAFTLMVSGTNFVNGATVRWNGNNRTTIFVNSTKLTASIPASDIANAGSANITVFNPAPGGGTSAAASFTITPPVLGNGLMFYPLDRPFRLLDTRPANERPGPAFDTPGTKLIGVINAGTPRTQQALVTFDGQTIPSTARAIVGT